MGNTKGKKDDPMLRALQQSLPVLRKAAKLSQKDLASTLGVSRQTVNNWETEKTYLNPTQGLALMAIVQSYGNVYPGLQKVLEVYFAQQDEAMMVQSAKPRSPLEGVIDKYIRGRINASPQNEDQADEVQEELSVG